MDRQLGRNFQGKTIAVYGASSNIGSKFAQAAARRGATVIAIARNVKKIPLYSKLGESGSIEAVKADITKPKDVRQALRGRKIYATANFAVDFSPALSKAKEVNVLGEQHILNASVEYGVKRHIYISTIATLAPKSNIYRDTKLEAEKEVKEVGKKHHLDWIILRFANVLGTRTWDQPFKIIFPYLRIGVPKIPTDVKEAAFFYVTIETAIDAALAALEARPNQTITIFDGKITIGEYLSVMEKIYSVKRSFLPSKLLKFLAKYLGEYSPLIEGLAAGVDFMAHQPSFENETMNRELKLKTRDFHKWIKIHSQGKPR